MRRNTPALFWSRKHIDADGCWRWTGARDYKGYGRVSWESRNTQAHRVAYMLSKGPIPTGLQIDHLCRTRDCINPAHLEAVTGKTNKQRGITKNELKECCPRGHRYDTAYSTGRRGCRECNAAAAQRSRRRSGRFVGLGKGGVERMKTHCPQGHEYTASNIYSTRLPSGSLGRRCRECGTARQRAYDARRKAAA